MYSKRPHPLRVAFFCSTVTACRAKMNKNSRNVKSPYIGNGYKNCLTNGMDFYHGVFFSCT